MKAVGFDLGDTLIYYQNVPLSWKSLYKQALVKIAEELNVPYSNDLITRAENVLSFYNTRINPRDYEVTDTDIFISVLAEWGVNSHSVDQVINIFFGFFQQQSKVYADTAIVFEELKRRNYKIGILTDVPYGMNKSLVLKDIEPIREYIDVLITSVDVGFRKPRPEGFKRLWKELGSESNQLVYVGNEQKDITGANHSGMRSILINREQQQKDWNQQVTLGSLTELMDCL
ncbi:MAG: hypothetical protein K0R57_2471 [Paenibacillaceae bacterium]|jgi:putative hydrolase of the HAD superfamily|nr:hypothetical protein [Paenibacillaceae bacterium]